MMVRLWGNVSLVLAVYFCFVFRLAQAQAITLDLSSMDSVKSTARQLAESCMKFYDGERPGGIRGLLPPSAAGQYNWWQAGALWGLMVEYWYYTGDDTWNDVVTEALLFQVGPDVNFEPTNQTRTEGNDDQAFWALAAMSAAECKFPDPAPGRPQWLPLAQAVFNRQAARWDTENCGGGLRWQFNPLNNGWRAKNTISNGCFYALAARLARYTNNATYAEWAEKTYDWMWESQLINKETWEVYDSYNFNEQTRACPDGPIGMVQWTYNIGTILVGTAFMYNWTNGDAKWEERLNKYLENTQRVFFPAENGGQVMTEYACETQGNCNKDQRSFKAYLSQWLALTIQVAPYTQGTILPWLQGSANAAVRQCVAGPGDTVGGPVACGRRWYAPQDDGERDVGNQMCAMGIVQANLVMSVAPPVDHQTGTSVGDASAGSGATLPLTDAEKLATRKMTTADRVGAWVVTAVMVILTVAFLVTVLKDDSKPIGLGPRGALHETGEELQLQRRWHGA